MNKINERPVCHRAEDLVSYLYGEASADEAHDFAQHLERCESCKAEFASFSSVHESITTWRNEALGSSVRLHADSPIVSEAAASSQFQQGQRKQSARAALREFFAMSPLWLRGATAVATLLLFVLGLFAVSRMWMRGPQLTTNNAEKVFTTAEFHEAVNKAVEEARMNASKNAEVHTTQSQTTASPVTAPRSKITRPQVARSSRTRLSPQERQQLAADLRLIPGREDDLPFVFSDEPEQ